jgi:lysophospholipase L1-like esterase
VGAAAPGSDSFAFQVTDPDGGVDSGVGTVVIDPRVMPLGDSITAGVTDGTGEQPVIEQRTGYRGPLYTSLRDAGYNVDFVGGLRSGDGVVDFDPDHEGHIGWSTAEIANGSAPRDTQFPDSGIYAWLTNNPADFVLLHVGTDVLDGDASGVVAILDEIDRWERDTGDQVLILVARSIDRNPLDPAVTVFQDAVSAAVEARISDPDDPAYPDRIILVDQQAALTGDDGLPDPAYYGDGLHPNASGYARMAETWLQAITENCSASTATVGTN